MTREVLFLLVGLANFLRKLIPAHAIAHAGAQLPLERFRLRIDPGPELIEPLADSAGIDVELAGGVDAGRVSQRLNELWALIEDRKSTRLNSGPSQISYAVFCVIKTTVHTRVSD